MKPTLLSPSVEQLRSMASLRSSPQWSGFGEWLDAAYNSAVKQTLSCAVENLTAARSMAAALSTIKERLDTAPDALRDTGKL